MKPIAIIVDIDGTLAHLNNRSPYDPSRYLTDTVDEVVRDLTWMYKNEGYKIIVCSGRDSTYREVTKQWLRDNKIVFDALFMRDPLLVHKGRKLDDAIIKELLYKEHIELFFDVKVVLDDRNRVVAMWRRNGLKVLQVADGDF